jgi:hypothetical protein
VPLLAENLSDAGFEPEYRLLAGLDGGPALGRLFSTVRAALMSGNLVSDWSGVMSIPTKAACCRSASR